ncbi:MAG: GGDEF domain-containing protein [Phycisphaerales bacterium JB063]
MDQARAQEESRTHEPSEGVRPRPHRLDDAPLRSKVALMVIAGVMIGIGVDLASDYLGQLTIAGRVVPSALFGVLGFLIAASVLIALGQWWIASPYDRLVEQIDRVAERRKMDDLSSLPLTRRDEAGRIARAMHRVTTIAIRDGRDARQLRRTLDLRVQKATQQATVELKRMALRDPLTDLGNRRFLDHQLKRIVEATEKSGSELTAVAIDLDGFKQVNDSRGHDAGDELLVLLAGLLKACTRHDDLCIRFGGDEFIILMPGCDTARAIAVADSIRSIFKQQTRSTLPQGPYTDLSIGVASINHDLCDDGEALLKLADQRLYAAKRAGKGRTVAQ